jgi:hypothetical protein
MLDLALEMGVSPQELARDMPEWQFAQWQHYAARKMLPNRRLELYLAQLAMWTAKAAGVKNVQLTDFLFDHVEKPDEPADAAAFFQFRPRKKKR